ncbi:MAG: tetratricopeptide repeat protein, partial [Promethearchaeota archaeon]
MVSNNSDNIKKTSNILIFISIWDEEVGPTIVDIHPRVNIGNIEQITIQIFQAYQFFWDSPDKPYNRAKMVLPFRNINKKAKIFFDIIPNPDIRGGFQPFNVVILCPDYFSDENLYIYDEIMLKISKDFAKQQNIRLENYYQEVYDLLALEEINKNEPVELEDNYSYTIAMDDFQAGIKLFQTRNYKEAYNLLKKVLIKFEQENHRNLIMEVVYLIASLLAQQKEFNNSYEFFSRLESLSIELEHQKYLEISRFMKGFCAYKNENFVEALENLKKIEILSSQNINKIQYFMMHGNILQQFKRLEESLISYKNALDLIHNSPQIDKLRKQQAHILYEIGYVHYKIAVQNLRNLGLDKMQDNETNFNESIRYLDESVKILTKLNDYDFLIQVYQLIGTIFELLGNMDNSIYYFKEAMDLAMKNKRFGKKLTIITKLIQKQAELEKHEKNVKIIENLLKEIDNLKLVDLHTIATFHVKLGESLIKIGNKEKGIKEMIEAHEIFKTFQTPVYNDLLLLSQIVNFFTEIKDFEKVTYYGEEINKISKELHEFSIQKPKLSSPLHTIGEIWIYSTSTG